MQTEIDLFIENNPDIEKEYIKSNNYRRTHILYEMTDSDIGEIIVDKNRELNNEIIGYKKEVVHFRWDSRKILELLSQDRQEEIRKLIKNLQFQLKIRDPLYSSEDISIEEMKSKIDIVSLIENITWESIRYARKLIKCPLKGHEDSTPSFKIYEHTDSFYCPWCIRGWDHINFIEYYYWIDRRQAIKQFKLLVK